MIRGWCGQGPPTIPLDLVLLTPLIPLCQPAGRPLLRAQALRPSGAVEESPGSRDQRWRLTAAGGDPRESATENRPPERATAKARVKRCGKSAPRVRQRRRHGKPHREQDRIGAARMLGRKPGHPARSSPPPGLVARGTEQSAPQRNGRRGGATLQTEPGLQAGWQLSSRLRVPCRPPVGRAAAITPWRIALI